MTTISIIWIAVAIYAGLWTSYVVLLPLFGYATRSVGADLRDELADVTPSIIVLVPAHNVAREIDQCIAVIQANNYPGDSLEICVVADHCTDDTADLARAAGASVLVRNEGPPGKTYTLAWALEELAARDADPDLYMITDTTARIEAGFLDAIADQWRRGENIIVGHPVLDPSNQQWFARCLGLMLAHRNLQNWSRQRLSLSALIEGRGMAYSRMYIGKFGWSLALPTSTRKGTHPTEDWRHGVQAVEHGFRVAFADDARVTTPLRDSLTAATQQGARWERGRMLNAATHGLRLLSRGLRRGDKVKVLAALDAIQPPVAILGVLSLIIAATSFAVLTHELGRTVGFVPLVLLAVYGLFVVAKGRKDGIGLTAVLWAPLYLIWRLTSFILAWAFLDRLDLGARRKKRENT